MASSFRETPTDKDGLLLKNRCEDNDVNFLYMQPHYYRMWQAEPCNRLSAVARRYSWAIELLAPYLNKNTNTRYTVQLINGKIGH